MYVHYTLTNSKLTGTSLKPSEPRIHMHVWNSELTGTTVFRLRHCFSSFGAQDTFARDRHF